MSNKKIGQKIRQLMTNTSILFLTMLLRLGTSNFLFIFSRWHSQFLIVSVHFLTPSWRRSNYRIETSPLIWSANQWTGFYMIRTSIMKELRKKYKLAIFDKVASLRLQKTLAQVFSCEFCEISRQLFLQNSSGRIYLWE